MTDEKLRELGYRPRFDFVSGLTETIEWYRQNRKWWEPLKYERVSNTAVTRR